MATTSNMFLYSLTIQPPTSVTQAITGQFSGTKEQQIIAASGSNLVLLRPDTNSDKIIKLLSHNVFGIIRSIASFRLAGGSKDYVILATDSGRIAIIEYIPATNRFARVHLETFGKSGVRRTIPGQYLAADPKGRACMIASVEKNKLVYVLNRNAEAGLTISSPLEAHKHGVLIFSVVALDVGYANPVFAALETDYSELEQDESAEVEVQLVYYELDLGLNHVVRKWSEAVDPTSSLLFQVPGGHDGPSGVLVCGEESITYRHSNQEAFRIPIPRRRGATEDPQRKRTIVSGVMHKLKGSASAFFFLLQSDDGDLFKVTFDLAEDADGKTSGEVGRIKIKYFDTIPLANSICILKSGYLFSASEFGNHHFYQFEKLGDDDGDAEFSSDDFPTDPKASYQPVYFHLRPRENLALVESVSSMSPLMDCKVANLSGAGEDIPQIYTVSGNGARSTFRMLKYGLEVNELVASELPGTPSAVWTTKLTQDDKYDAYIILTFLHDTMVLRIGETVTQVTDSGFLTTVATLAVQQIGNDSLLQIYSKGMRHVRQGQVTEWPAPQHRSIVAAATNEHQVAIALSSGEVVYFEVDENGDLAEFDEKKEMGSVTSLSLCPIPKGRRRGSFLAVGCDDCTVRILSLELESTLESKSVQALTAAPSALCIMYMEDSFSGGSALYLHIGLNSGVYLRTTLDEITGDLADTRLRFLGPKPINLSSVTVQGQNCVLALSTTSWIGYNDPIMGGFLATPLAYHELEWAWNFTSEQCEDGIVGIHSNCLHIFSIENIQSTFIQKSLPLTYTPRQLVKHPDQPYFYTIESENNTLDLTLRTQLRADSNAINGDAKELSPVDFGLPGGKQRWASCISVISPIGENPSVLEKIELDENEATVSLAVVPFTGQDNESFLIVGTGRDMIVNPRQSSAGFIHVYRFLNDGRNLEFIHKTQVEEPPTALQPFNGRLIAGIGKNLRIYDLGMRQLLRKAQADVAPQLIVSLQTQGSRIVVGDVQHGVTMVVYKSGSNMLIPFVDDTISRWTTCTTMVDYESVAGGDKFGNLWVLRCPDKASAEADEPGSDVQLTNGRRYLHGAPERLQLMAHMFVQDIPTSICKTGLVVGGQDVLLWSGLQGTIGVLVPLTIRENAEFFQALEMHMRSEDPPLAGREHLMYRGNYVPVKGILDGDLCERFSQLPREKKEMIAGQLDRSVREVERRISDIRVRSAF